MVRFVLTQPRRRTCPRSVRWDCDGGALRYAGSGNSPPRTPGGRRGRGRGLSPRGAPGRCGGRAAVAGEVGVGSRALGQPGEMGADRRGLDQRIALAEPGEHVLAGERGPQVPHAVGEELADGLVVVHGHPRCQRREQGRRGGSLSGQDVLRAASRAIRRAATSASTCSQNRRGTHPATRRRKSVSRSRRRTSRSLRAHHSAFAFGGWKCCGQRCQKQPSEKTAILAGRRTRSARRRRWVGSGTASTWYTTPRASRAPRRASSLAVPVRRVVESSRRAVSLDADGGGAGVRETRGMLTQGSHRRVERCALREAWSTARGEPVADDGARRTGGAPADQPRLAAGHGRRAGVRRRPRLVGHGAAPGRRRSTRSPSPPE